MDDTSLQIDNRKPSTVKMIVCAGRSVQVGNPFKIVQVETAGVTRWVKEPVSTGKVVLSEGEEVELPRADADRLAALGFVYFPDARPAFSRPLGAARADNEPMVDRPSPDGPTTAQIDDDPDSDMGRPIGITQIATFSRGG